MLRQRQNGYIKASETQTLLVVHRAERLQFTGGRPIYGGRRILWFLVRTLQIVYHGL